MKLKLKIEADEIADASWKYMSSIAEDAKHQTARYIVGNASPKAARVAALACESIDRADVMPTAFQLMTTVGILSVALELSKFECEEAGQMAAQYLLEMRQEHPEEMKEPSANSYRVASFEFHSDRVSEKNPQELGRYIAGMGGSVHHLKMMMAFVDALLNYSEAQAEELQQGFKTERSR